MDAVRKDLRIPDYNELSSYLEKLVGYKYVCNNRPDYLDTFFSYHNTHVPYEEDDDESN